MSETGPAFDPQEASLVDLEGMKHELESEWSSIFKSSEIVETEIPQLFVMNRTGDARGTYHMNKWIQDNNMEWFKSYSLEVVRAFKSAYRDKKKIRKIFKTIVDDLFALYKTVATSYLDVDGAVLMNHIMRESTGTLLVFLYEYLETYWGMYPSFTGRLLGDTSKTGIEHLLIPAAPSRKDLLLRPATNLHTSYEDQLLHPVEGNVEVSHTTVDSSHIDPNADEALHRDEPPEQLKQRS